MFDLKKDIRKWIMGQVQEIFCQIRKGRINKKASVFCDFAPCSLVETDRRFRGVYCLRLQGLSLFVL